MVWHICTEPFSFDDMSIVVCWDWKKKKRRKCQTQKQCKKENRLATLREMLIFVVFFSIFLAKTFWLCLRPVVCVAQILAKHMRHQHRCHLFCPYASSSAEFALQRYRWWSLLKFVTHYICIGERGTRYHRFNVRRSIFDWKTEKLTIAHRSFVRSFASVHIMIA